MKYNREYFYVRSPDSDLPNDAKFNFLDVNFIDSMIDPWFYFINRDRIFFSNKKYGDYPYVIVVISPEGIESEHMCGVIHLEKGLLETDFNFFTSDIVRELIEEWPEYKLIKEKYEIDDTDNLMNVFDYPGQFMVKVVDGIKDFIISPACRYT